MFSGANDPLGHGVVATNLSSRDMVGRIYEVNHLRIEIDILSLHWMTKNISYLNVFEAQSKLKI